MCRIAGIYNYSGKQDLKLSDIGNNMRNSLSYGGPDDAGGYEEDGLVYLGHRRLSILDVTSAGHQPMFFKDLAIVYNGEIYNFQEIKDELTAAGYTFHTHSDTEVILAAFDKWSYDAVNKFRGMFAIAIWNRATQKLLLCRDRVGVKPLYYYQHNGIFLFASELKAFHQYPGYDKEIDQQAVSLFLQTGYIKAPLSIFKRTKKLLPGAFLEIDRTGVCKEWKYWDVNAIEVQHDLKGRNETQIIEECETILSESFQLRMVSDVPVGIFLSGGIDSSLVTALIQKDTPRPLKTFTIGFKEKRYDESGYARNIANHLGTDHTDIICDENDFKEIVPLLPDIYDEPFGDSSGIPTYMVSRLARKQVTVSLSADGADEIFTGYIRYNAVKDYYNKIKFLPSGLRKALGQGVLKLGPRNIEKVLQKVPMPYNFKGLEWRLPKLVEAFGSESELDFFEKISLYASKKTVCSLHRQLPERIFDTHSGAKKNELFTLLGKIDIGSYLEGDILTKVDRAGMQVALEGREPFLDHKIIEFALSLPDQYKFRDGKSKWLLRQILYKYVPREMMERPKQGFAIPVDKWLNEFLKEEVTVLSGDAAFCNTFMLDSAVLKEIISRHFSDDKSVNPHFVWFLYCLYAWYKKWM